MSDSYYIRSQGKVHGPFSFDDLKAKAGKGHLKKTHQVSTDKKNWLAARRVEGLFPPPPARPDPMKGRPEQPMLAEPELVEVTLLDDEPAVVTASEEEMEWHYCLQGDEHTQGPVPESKLRRLFQSGRLPLDTLVWNETLTDWVEATRIPALHAGPKAGPVITTDVPIMDPAARGNDLPIPPMASASLILAILGLLAGVIGGGIGSLAFPNPLVGALGFGIPGLIAGGLAVVFGHLSLAKIKANRRLYQGANLAKTGLILGYAVLAILLLAGSTWLIIQLAKG